MIDVKNEGGSNKSLNQDLSIKKNWSKERGVYAVWMQSKFSGQTEF